MRVAFADTSYFIALVCPRDQWRGVAYRASHEWGSKLLTTRAVLMEFGNALAAPRFRGVAARFIRALVSSSSVEILPLDDDLWGRGLERYENRPDKAWSLTDCISFVAMEDRGIRDALTGDKHFEQAGFNVLLKRGD